MKISERLTANLTDRSAAALSQLCELTCMNKSDVVNRAIQLYMWIEDRKAAGEKILTQHPDGSCMQHEFF